MGSRGKPLTSQKSLTHFNHIMLHRVHLACMYYIWLSDWISLEYEYKTAGFELGFVLSDILLCFIFHLIIYSDCDLFVLFLQLVFSLRYINIMFHFLKDIFIRFGYIAVIIEAISFVVGVNWSTSPCTVWFNWLTVIVTGSSLIKCSVNI
jgi:hypothetical protein